MPADRVIKKPAARVAARSQYAKLPRKTTADDPAAYSKTPHEYGDILIRPDEKGRTKLGGALQRDLVYWIERHTWGKNVGTSAKVERPEYAKLSLSQLAKLCGSDRRTVARALADLAERRIIEARDREGCGPTVAKMYKLTPAQWKKAPYYEPPKLIDDDDEEEEDDQPEMEAPQAAAESREATVSPGKVSKAQRVAWSPSTGAPAVTIRVQYRNDDLPFPVSFTSRPGSNGKLQITCRATTLQRFANHSPSKSVVTVEDAQVRSYREFLCEFVLSFWGKAADESLINAVVTEANGAPVEIFERIVSERFKRGTGRHHSTGLLPALAADAAKTHEGLKLKNSQRPALREMLRMAHPAATDDDLNASIHLYEFCSHCEGHKVIGRKECEACRGRGFREKRA
jgi:hypothetical protein